MIWCAAMGTMQRYIFLLFMCNNTIDVFGMAPKQNSERSWKKSSQTLKLWSSQLREVFRAIVYLFRLPLL
jgi:hypothetical protein